ncbi:MAG TPA: hypothetical protein DDY49_08920 [Paenibacillaceae bacterium]|nr:hypothetical protein [Paenibacillaceae bacterium]
MNVWLSNKQYTKFKACSGIKYNFSKGYTQKAVKNALSLWVFYFQTHIQFTDIMLTIARNKYPEVKDEDELTRKAMAEAVHEYVAKNKDYLD